MKMTRRIFSLVLAMMMLVGTMFAIPAAALDHEHLEGEIVFYVMRDGVLIPMSEMVVVCGCSNPNYEDYCVNPHDYIRGEHTTFLVQYCTNCGWTYEYYADIVGCGFYCDLPKWQGG